MPDQRQIRVKDIHVPLLFLRHHTYHAQVGAWEHIQMVKVERRMFLLVECFVSFRHGACPEREVTGFEIGVEQNESRCIYNGYGDG